MGVNGANVEHSEDVVCLSEELVSEPSLSSTRSETPEKEDEDKGNDSPDHVGLGNPADGSRGLGLIKADLYETPTDRVKNGLKKDYMSSPSVKKVEMVVRYAGDNGK